MSRVPRAEWDNRERVLEVRSNIQDLVSADVELAKWCDEACLRRYLRAREGDVAKSTKLLRDTMIWRRRTRPQDRRCPQCLLQPLSHNARIVGFDALERPVLYTCFNQAHDRFNVDGAMAHLTYELEKCAKILSARQKAGIAQNERWVIFVDFCGYSLLDNNPSTSYATLCLLNNYPERLGTIILYGAPLMFGTLWRLVQPLVNEETSSKLKFVKASASYSAGDVFDTLELGDELAKWLREECADNRKYIDCRGTGVKPGSMSERNAKRYWEWRDEFGQLKPHDSRGTASFRASPWFEQTYAPKTCRSAIFEDEIANGRELASKTKLEKHIYVAKSPTSCFDCFAGYCVPCFDRCNRSDACERERALESAAETRTTQTAVNGAAVVSSGSRLLLGAKAPASLRGFAFVFFVVIAAFVLQVGR